MAIRANDIDWIASTIGKVGVRCIHANCVLIDVSLHLADIHLEFFVKRNDPGLDIEIVASLNSSHMTCFTDDNIGFQDTMQFHLVLPVG
jgi:hypothetical protein